MADPEYQEADDLGGNPVRVLRGVEAVRKRPGMYFGGLGTEAVEHLIGELVSNAIDSFLAGDGTGSVTVRLDGATIEVEDDGPGLPFELPDEDCAASLASGYLTRMHWTASAIGHAPHVHVHALHGVGLAAVNAVCRTLRCRSWRQGQHWEQEFADGEPLGPPRVIGTGDGRGTCLRLVPDAAILQATAPRPAMVRATLFHAAHLFPGLKLGFQDECFHAPDGLAALACIEQQATAREAHAWGERPVFHLQQRCGDVLLQAAAYGSTSDGACSWRTWVNGLPSVSHGVHQQGFRDALEQVGWTPNVALLHVVLYDTRYASPVRDKLVTPGVRETVAAGLAPVLEAWCREQRLGRFSNPPALPTLDAQGRDLRRGDWVRVTGLPVLKGLDRTARTAFRFAVGKTFRIVDFDRHGHAELNLSARLKSLQTIWIEPTLLLRTRRPATSGTVIGHRRASGAPECSPG